MKLSCLQENLSKGLSIVSRAVAGSKTTLPITNHILLVTDQSRLRLTATNLEIAINHWIGARVEVEGAITVPAKLFSEFVNQLPNTKIDLETTGAGRTLHLSCANFDAKMNGLDPEDFPPIPTVQDASTTSIDPETLKEAIGQVVFAAATDETRPVLAGVYTKLDGNQLTLAAADGFRLAVRHVTLERPVETPVEVIVPAKTYSELSRILGEQDEPVEITVTPTKGQILFQLQNTEMISQLIQGTFPNFQQLIPQSFASTVLLGADEFRNATRAAAIFARDSNQIIRLQIQPGEDSQPGKVTVVARADELGENQGDVEAVVTGEASRIAFNARYLTDVLGVLSSGQVQLQTNSPSSPGVFRQVGDDSYTHVIMPMYVQW